MTRCRSNGFASYPDNSRLTNASFLNVWLRTLFCGCASVASVFAGFFAGLIARSNFAPMPLSKARWNCKSYYLVKYNNDEIVWPFCSCISAF